MICIAEFGSGPASVLCLGLGRSGGGIGSGARASVMFGACHGRGGEWKQAVKLVEEELKMNVLAKVAAKI